MRINYLKTHATIPLRLKTPLADVETFSQSLKCISRKERKGNARKGRRRVHTICAPCVCYP
jgi:hypothetical protein